MMSQRVTLYGEVKEYAFWSRSESECEKRDIESYDVDTKPSDLSMARMKQG